MNNIIFFNHYGWGDIFTPREFVKILINVIPHCNFFFAHAKDKDILDDIPKLGFTPLDDKCDMRKSAIFYQDNLYINTWIGYAYDKYVEPGVVCSLDNFVALYNDVLKELGIDFKFQIKDLFAYIPTIDYSKLQPKYLSNIEKFSLAHPRIILISNNDVQSNQAENFDFTPVINRLCKDYTDFAIVTSDKTNLDFNNLFSTKEIIQKENGNDLREISYLSLFSEVIIGRSSAPYVYTQVKENYLNPNKKFIAFTYAKKGGHMAFFDVPAKKYWNKTLDYDLIRKAIDE